MPHHHGIARSSPADPLFPKGFEVLCKDLSRSGKIHLQRIASTLDEIAPTPGLIVCLYARPLTFRLNGLEPVIFSAIDCSTQLQVAEAYHSLTTAAALLFIDFVAQTFPFPISQVRTTAERPFHNPAGPDFHRDFSALVAERGLIHTLVSDPSRDALTSITSKLVFGGISEGTSLHLSTQGLQAQLDHFLLFHNNHRSVPWLDGKTPVQKLRTFEGFSKLRSFNPSVRHEAGVGHSDSFSAEVRVPRNDFLRRS